MFVCGISYISIGKWWRENPEKKFRFSDTLHIIKKYNTYQERKVENGK